MGRCPMKEAVGWCPLCDYDDAEEAKANLEGHAKGVPRRASREWGRKARAKAEHGPVPLETTAGEVSSGASGPDESVPGRVPESPERVGGDQEEVAEGTPEGE